ncbi:MAG: 4Fe-4S binding protein, partial [Syntrophothermus sp.]
VLSLFNNPWYKIPLEWYFIPVLGLAGGIIAPLFFGRHYCGQYCPMGFIADGINPVNKAGRLLKSKKLRILFLILFIGLFVVAFLPWNMGLPASMTHTYWEATMNKLWILWVSCPFGIALPLMLVLGFARGGRTWCTYLCPWGAIGNSLSKSQLEISSDCTDCKACLKVCPQPEILEGVTGKGGAVDQNCLLCLKCADACKFDAVVLRG